MPTVHVVLHLGIVNLLPTDLVRGDASLRGAWFATEFARLGTLALRLLRRFVRWRLDRYDAAMTLKEMVNSGLVRVTGYELARPRPNGALPAKKAAAAFPATKAAALALPKDYDSEAASTIRAVKPWTMTSPDKLYALILAVRHVVKHKIPGDIVECGVWRGGSMQATARTLLEVGDTSRHLYLFDTFEGMPPPTEEDRRHDGKSAADLLASERAHVARLGRGLARRRAGRHGAGGLPRGPRALRPGHGRGDRAPRGARADLGAASRHRLVRLDQARARDLYPRLVSGGVLLIDDYGWWEGAKKAVDEFLEESGEQLLLLRMASGRIAVKP